MVLFSIICTLLYANYSQDYDIPSIPIQNLLQFLHKLGPNDQIYFIAFGFTWYQGRPPVDRHESNDFHPAPQLAF